MYVDLDPVPGVMHSQESAQHVIANLLVERIPHYKPTVSLAPVDLQPEIQEEN